MSSSTTDSLSHEEQARRILQVYDSKMVKILPTMMKKFEGKESQLVSMLVKKHGPVPTDAELAAATTGTAGTAGTGAKPPSRNATPTSAGRKTPPPKALDGGAAANSTSPTPAAATKPRSSSAVGKKAPSAPPATTTPTTTSQQPTATAAASPPPPANETLIQAQCRRILEKHDPKMVKMLPGMIKKFGGKEQNLLNMLIKKHGPVPPPNDDDSSTAAAPTTATATPPRATTPVKKAPPAPTIDKEGKQLPSTPSPTPPKRQPTPTTTSVTTTSAAAPSHVDQVRAILQEKDPKMVKVLPGMLQKFVGKEPVLLSMMQKKHNVTPAESLELVKKHGSAAVAPTAAAAPQAPKQKTPPPKKQPAPAPPQQQQQRNRNDDDRYSDEEEEFFEEEEEEEFDDEQQQQPTRTQTRTPPASTTTAAAAKKQPPPSTAPQPAVAPTTVSASSTSTSSPQPPPSIEEQIRAVLEEKDPKMIKAVPSMMEKFQGKEQTLLNMMLKKHKVGPNESIQLALAKRPKIDSNNSNSAAPATTTTQRPRGPSVAKKNPDQHQAAAGVAEQQQQPQQESSNTTTTAQSSGDVQQQQQQSSSDAQQQQQRPRGASSSAVNQQQSVVPLLLSPDQHATLKSDLRVRLLRCFQHYDPSMILNIDAELNKYYNSNSLKPEQDFWADIRKHHQSTIGNKPEPVASSPDTQLLLDRIRRMYVHYDPTVLSSELPAAMQEYRGREAELLKRLTSKYGSEPPNQDHLIGGGQQQQQQHNNNNNYNNSNNEDASNNNNYSSSYPPAIQQLNATQKRAYNFYRHYDKSALDKSKSPDGQSEFDRMLKQYAGREYDLLEDLTKKYGPEPRGKHHHDENNNNNNDNNALSHLDDASRGSSLLESETLRRIRNMYQHYDPQEAHDIPIRLERYGKGNEQKFLQDLVAKYGPEPPLREVADPEVLQQRAANVVQHYDPEASSKVPALLNRFKGREDQLLRTLVRKYGPEPLDQLGSTSGQFSNEAAIPPTVSENIAEIRELVTKHEPESAPALPGLLQRYSGKEETLLQLLRQRYGTSIMVEGPYTSSDDHLNNNQSPSGRQRAVSFVDGGINNNNNGNQNMNNEEDPRIKGSIISIENRIRRILEINQPELVSSNEKFAQVMKEHEGKEEEYLNELIANHGPEPEFTAASASNRKPKFDHPKEASARQKLTALFTHYDRMQLPRIDEWLEKYVGREDEMVTAVHKKYSVPPPQTPPAWLQPLQTLCLAHGMNETFLEKLISSMGSAASKDNVTFELLSIWYPDFVSSLMTDEGQRRTLTAKRLARFLSVVSPGRVNEIPEMLHQVVSGGQSSEVVLGDMLLTFYREAMVNAVVPRLDHSSLREKDDVIASQQQGDTNSNNKRSVGAGFIGNVEQLKKLTDIWHQQRHHTRTTPTLLGTSATDLIRFSKINHRAVGPDELLVKPVRTLGTDTETDAGNIFGSGLPMDGRTIDPSSPIGGGDNNNMNNNNNSSRRNNKNNNNNTPFTDATTPQPPNPLLFSRFGLANEDMPRTRWGCPNCEALREFTEQNESRWQSRMKEQEVKSWKMMQELSLKDSNRHQQQQPNQKEIDEANCTKCPLLSKEIESLRHRVHQLQTRSDQRAILDSANQKVLQQQHQQQLENDSNNNNNTNNNIVLQRNADGTVGNNNNSNNTSSSSSRNQPTTYASPRRLFQIEHPPPVAINRFNSSSVRNTIDSGHDLVPRYHTNATAPSALRQPSSALQRSQELWSSLYNNSDNNGNNNRPPGGVILPSSENAKKVLGML